MFKQTISKKDMAISEKTDDEIIDLFYSEYENEPNTLKAFKREIRRFMYWLHVQDESLKLKDVNFVVVKAYQDLLSYIPDEAISTKVVKYHSNTHENGINPEWRPFKQKSLSNRSIRAAMNLLSSFGNWLVNKEYLPANPFQSVRKPKGDKQSAQQRLENEVDASKHFTTDQMNLILSVINQKISDADAAGDDRALLRWRRFKFIFTFMRRTGLRREEMVAIQWKNIKTEERDDGAEMQLIKGLGKGTKTFEIPLAYDAFEELENYQADLIKQNSGDRNFVISDTILKGYSGKKSIDVKTLHVHFKGALSQIADYLEENWNETISLLPFKLNKVVFLSSLRAASLHYMRHSAITENGKYFKDIKQLQEFARHSNIQITASVYWHTEKSDLHKAVNRE